MKQCGVRLCGNQVDCGGTGQRRILHTITGGLVSVAVDSELPKDTAYFTALRYRAQALEKQGHTRSSVGQATARRARALAENGPSYAAITGMKNGQQKSVFYSF